MNSPIIQVNNVSKKFEIPHERISSLRSAFVQMFTQKTYETFHALDNVSFDVARGEFLGIIGKNGSGKSTLLKILAGLYQADSGSITVKGKVVPFLELGIGFNPELSGRDNIFLNGIVLGLSRKQIEQKFKAIVEFSGLERFIDQKLKRYSSGMYMRLAFSIAIHTEGDILIMDEVLAVGDAEFQHKCISELLRLKKAGKTIILVTHGEGPLQDFADRVVFIEQGKVRQIGKSEQVLTTYRSTINS